MSTPFNQDPLSVRLNNPGNLRFVGQAGAVADPSGFARFNTPEEGMTAMQRQLELDLQQRGLTLEGFLNKYAPPSENNTQNYLRFVADKTGLDPTQRVPADAIPKVMEAMITMEGGPKASQRYSQVAQAPTSTATDAPPAEAGSVFDKYSTGFGRALEANDTEAAEYLSNEAQEKLRKGISKARAAKDEEAAQFLEGQLRTTTEQIYARAQQSGNPKLAESVRSQARKGGKWTFDAANSDPIWIQNAKTLYKDVEGKDFEGEPAEAANWLKNFMGQFEWNLAATGITAASTSSWSDQGKVAFLNSLKDYQDLPNFETEAIGRAIKGVATDPTTYVGLGVGKVISKVGGKAAQTAIKEAIQQGLEKNIAKRVVNSTAAKVGAEGAVYAGTGNVLEQAAEVGAGGKESIDLGQAGLATATGFGVGAGAGKIIDKVTGRTAVEQFAKRAGSEEVARIDAEVAQRASEIASDPLRATGGKAPGILQVEDLNQAVQKSFTDPVSSALKALPKDARPGNYSDLLSALNAPRKLSEAQRDALRGTPYGDAVVGAVERAIRAKTITSAIPSRGGITPLLRTGIDVLPISQILRYPLQRMLGARQSREIASGKLLKQGEAVGRILDELGPSRASASLGNIQQMAQSAKVAEDARKTMSAEAVAKQAAERELSSKIIADQFDQGLLQEGGVQATFVGRKGLPTDPTAIVRGLNDIKTQNKDLAEAIEAIRKNDRVSDIKRLGAVQAALRKWAKDNNVDIYKENANPFSVGSGVLFDSSGNPIRNRLAYEAAAEGNQARVTQTLASVAQANLSQEGKGAVANAVTQIGTAKTKAQAKLYMESAMQALSPGERKEAQRLLQPLLNQIKND